MTSAATVQPASSDRELSVERDLTTMLSSLAEIVQFDQASVLLRQPESDDLMFVAYWSARPISYNPVGLSLPPGRGIVQRVAQSGRAAIITHPGRDPEYFNLDAVYGKIGPPTSMGELALPLVVDGEVIGVLNLESRKPGTLGQEELQKVKPAARLIAAALNYTRRYTHLRDQYQHLEAQLQEAESHLEQVSATEAEVSHSRDRLGRRLGGLFAMHRVGTEISGTLDRQALLDHIVAVVTGEFGYEFGLIMLVEGAQLVARSGLLAERRITPSLALPFDPAQPLWAALTDEGRPVACSSEQNGLYLPLLKQLHLGSAIITPLLGGGRLAGLLIVGSTLLAQADADDLDVFAIIGGQLVGALYSLAQLSDAEKRAQQLELIYRTSLEITRQRELQNLLDTVTLHSVSLLSARGAAIYLYDSSQHRLECVTSYNLDRDYCGTYLAVGEGLAGQVAASRQPLRVNNYRTWEGKAARYADSPFTAVIASPLLNKRGKLIGVLDVLDDSDRRVFSDDDEQMLVLFTNQAAAVLETARIYTDLRSANEQLLSISRLKTEFLSTISHELRTPLNSIIGYVDMLLDGLFGELNEGQQTSLGRVQRNAGTLLNLITDVLDLSKIEAGRFELFTAPFSVRELILTVLNTVGPLAQQKKLALRHYIDPQLPPTLVGDSDRLQQILLNLASNAVKFTNTGSVTVRARRVSNELYALTVTDTGIGIPQDKYALIFEEFRQADGSTTRQYGGTGLGLAITRRLATLMGGTVAVFSKGEGEGSTFTITLPLISEQPEPGQFSPPEVLPLDEEEEETHPQVEWDTPRMIGDRVLSAEGPITLQEAHSAEEGGSRVNELLKVANEREETV